MAEKSSNAQLEVTGQEIERPAILTVNLNSQAELLATMRAVAKHYYGALGTFAYDCYEWVNREFYGGDLPVPLIIVALTGWGGCVGYTRSADMRQPVIKLHPSTIAPASRNAWGGIPAGVTYASEVLLHELVHVGVNYTRGWGAGDSSHNNDGWISEINRISPLIGLGQINAGRVVAKRVKEAGEKRGKVQKVPTGDLTQGDLAKWPHCLRSDDYYKTALPLFELRDPIEDIRREAALAQG